MRKKRKGTSSWHVVLFLAVFGLLLAGTGFAKPAGRGGRYETTADLNKKRLGGIAGSMTEPNVKLLFETILGVRLSGYEGYATADEALFALHDGRVDALWFPDVTAAYLAAQNKDLYEIPLQKEETGRFSLAMAFRADDETRCGAVSAAIETLRGNGMLTGLQNAYIKAETPLVMGEEEMAKAKGETVYVGVTGTLPPVDRFDGNGKPCGFSVALLEEIGRCTGYRFVLVPVDNETAFTLLESGKIDAVFAYGTSENTTPGKKKVLTTTGYYTVQHYSYLAAEEK